MRFAPTLRFFSLPALAVLAGLAVACSDDAPTAPQPAPAFAKIRATLIDDTNMKCPRGYRLVSVGFDHPVDKNLNLLICEWTNGEPQLYVDDNARGGCPSGYQLIQVSFGVWGKQADINGNDYICQLMP